MLAWGWYAVTNLTKAIPVADDKSGFRVRKHNIQVGEKDFLTSFFPKGESRGNKYFYGEIHVVNNKIKLNSARDGFAPTPEGEVLKVNLRNFCAELVKIYHLANTVKNSISKVLDDKTITDQKVKEEKINNVVQSFEDKKNSQSEVAKTIIKSYQDKAKEEISKAEEVPTKATSGSSVVVEPIKTQPKSPSEPLKVDIFEELKNNYTEREINIIKKIFELLVKFASYTQKEMIRKLKDVVLDKLKNEKF